MIKAMITPEMWEELNKVLCKLQIGYTVSFDSHEHNHREMLITMNPIGVQYYDSDNFVRTAEGVPKGKWEKVNGAHRCSNCQEYAQGCEDIEFLTHFCPTCGAELENWED